MMQHIRRSLIKGDLVICPCCNAIGEVITNQWWIFKWTRIRWFESDAGRLLVENSLNLEEKVPRKKLP